MKAGEGKKCDLIFVLKIKYNGSGGEIIPPCHSNP
jgi:hypothetical protein